MRVDPTKRRGGGEQLGTGMREGGSEGAELSAISFETEIGGALRRSKCSSAPIT